MESDERNLEALRWCARNGATVDFGYRDVFIYEGKHVPLTLQVSVPVPGGGVALEGSSFAETVEAVRRAVEEMGNPLSVSRSSTTT